MEGDRIMPSLAGLEPPRITVSIAFLSEMGAQGLLLPLMSPGTPSGETTGRPGTVPELGRGALIRCYAARSSELRRGSDAGDQRG